jgi:hypothetical protein
VEYIAVLVTSWFDDLASAPKVAGRSRSSPRYSDGKSCESSRKGVFGTHRKSVSEVKSLSTTGRSVSKHDATTCSVVRCADVTARVGVWQAACHV